MLPDKTENVSFSFYTVFPRLANTKKQQQQQQNIEQTLQYHYIRPHPVLVSVGSKYICVCVCMCVFIHAWEHVHVCVCMDKI